ncbi:NAD(P)/FAD-dependent oxidoreductase [Streptomyces sp. NPDC096142]|uniref:NAD(P)/FAD-dependent oxidoreductase n=1 Tax=Streptomyces sp. NPDC096142 TaxID=3366077 RepID=UPI00382C4B03
METEKVAVIGGGVAGLTAAYFLRHDYDVVLFEAAPRLGGHADTHDVATPDGATVRLDTGFLVHNLRNYPHLLRLFAELDVPTEDSEMSMSIRCRGCGLEYAGGRRGLGLLPGPRTATRPFLHLLSEIPRFHREARRLLESGDSAPTLGGFLAKHRFTRYFADHFALPLVSAVWSAGAEISTAFPAVPLFTFLENHGLLSVRAMPRWRTVRGGSRTYVERIAARLPDVRTSTPVRGITRHADGVDVVDAAGTTHAFDRVVVATHADQALALLGDATADEKQILGAFGYSRNETWLHTDSSVLPSRPRTRASWNLLKQECGGGSSVLVSYHLNRLMRLSEPLDYLVTLNGATEVDEAAVLVRRVYEHPILTADTLAAQRRLARLNSPVVVYAGAYHGWGFHEDGCLAGVRAAAALGVRR